MSTLHRVEVLSSRILLRPRDLAASRAFYEQRLGLKVYREYGVGGRVTGGVFFLGGGFLELAGSGTGMPAAPDGPIVWLQVDDVDAEHERLVAAGVPVDEPPADMPWGLREMWIHDPDELRLVVVEVPEDHPLRRRV
jgi:catechol 2,3-dioxygenase-like lactoylglutathione lyase family enzyme